MEWYIPITILPGIALIILSTSNILIALNNEIKDLNKDKEKYGPVIIKKLIQLKELNYALIGAYIAAFLLVIAGVLGQIMKNELVLICLIIIGVVFLSISLGLLILYSLKSLKIRQEHLKL